MHENSHNNFSKYFHSSNPQLLIKIPCPHPSNDFTATVKRSSRVCGLDPWSFQNLCVPCCCDQAALGPTHPALCSPREGGALPASARPLVKTKQDESVRAHPTVHGPGSKPSKDILPILSQSQEFLQSHPLSRMNAMEAAGALLNWTHFLSSLLSLSSCLLAFPGLFPGCLNLGFMKSIEEPVQKHQCKPEDRV